MGRRKFLSPAIFAVIPGIGMLTQYGSQGQMHRRPDQQTDAPPSAVAPTQAAGILRARSVILFGTGNAVGLFEYSGTPALGNNPVGYAVPPGVTKDPFGNTLPVTGGGFVSVNASFMIAALRSAGLQFHHPGTDFGVAAPSLTAQGSNALGATVVLDSGAATGATDSTLTLNDSIVGAVGRRVVTLNTDQEVISTTGGTPSTTALLEVQGAIQTTSLNSIIANGNLQSQLGDCTISAGKLNIAAATTPGQPGTGFSLHDDANSFPRVKVALAGDTNDYFTVYSDAGASATPQTISSTVAATITGCTFPVGIGNYAFRARVVFQGASASGTANFSVSAPANTGPEINAAFNMSSGTAGAGVQLSALGPVNSPTQTTGNSIAEIEGELTTTASGTLALQCATSAGGANVLIEKARFWLYPIL